MNITDIYTDELSKLPVLTNEQFMAWQIWQLQHIFNNDIAAIKNRNCEFLAFTEFFANEFNVGSELLGKTAAAIPSDYDNAVYTAIHEQEQKIITEAKGQDAVYMHKQNGVVSIYAVRKKPLTNPYTNETVGIFINTAKFVPNVLRMILDNQLLHQPQHVSNSTDRELSPLQQQVLFCLLMGFTARKDITATLSRLTGSEYNETQVKNTLQALYLKFECNSPNQLVEMIMTGQIKLNIPAGILPAGIFPIKDS